MSSYATLSGAPAATIGSPRGKFLTFEGIDGAGKSTHVSYITEWLTKQGHRVVATREPGGTPIGEQLRELVLHTPMHLETEALIMFASRREHIAQVIEPALASGAWVVCDRFTDASFAYQGGGRGLAKEKLEALEQWVHPALQPDLTLLFDVPIEVARERLENSRAPDKFESERSEFFTRTRDAYLARAKQDAARVRIVDSTQSIDTIRAQLRDLIAAL